MMILGTKRAVACRAALLLALATSMPGVQAAGEQCSATQKCPQDSPCCSSSGTCGSGAMQCADNCNPMGSFTAGSCQANPICANKNITFVPSDYKNAKQFMPILLYNGDASRAPFTLDYGSLGKGPEGVLLELTEASQTRLSTTDYMLYGNVQLTARHDAHAGLVFTFITMSDSKDEIDWEFTTADPKTLQTNYFAQGQASSGTAKTVNAPSQDFTTSDWHTYGLNWQADSLQWLVDGKVVRTVSRQEGSNNYPRSPSRVQISMWAGGNSTNEPGVITWAGGPIDWSDPTYTSQGFFAGEIKSFVQTCAATNADPSIGTTGSGKTPTSWVYTGNTSSTLSEPEFVLSTDPIKFLDDSAADGTPGMPGYNVQTPFTKSNDNAWDGSGDTSGLDKSELSSSSGASKQGGWLNNSRTQSIAVPVLAGIGALLAIWAICCCVSRRRRRKRANREGPLANMGDMAEPKAIDSDNMADQHHRSPSVVAMLRNGTSRVPSNYTASRYRALGDEDEHYVPSGTQRMGQGYGPAAASVVGYASTPTRSGMTSSQGAYAPVTRGVHGDSYDPSNFTRTERPSQYQQYAPATQTYQYATPTYPHSRYAQQPVANAGSYDQYPSQTPSSVQYSAPYSRPHYY